MFIRHVATSPRSTPVWALIHRGANDKAFVVASCRGVSADVRELGADCDSLGTPKPPHTGFWLWKGVSRFDGIDDCWLESDHEAELLTYRGAACRMNMHENY